MVWAVWPPARHFPSEALSTNCKMEGRAPNCVIEAEVAWSSAGAMWGTAVDASHKDCTCIFWASITTCPAPLWLGTSTKVQCEDQRIMRRSQFSSSPCKHFHLLSHFAGPGSSIYHSMLGLGHAICLLCSLQMTLRKLNLPRQGCRKTVETQCQGHPVLWTNIYRRHPFSMAGLWVASQR